MKKMPQHFLYFQYRVLETHFYFEKNRVSVRNFEKKDANVL